MKKPRILLLPDFPNWAFDYIARSIAARLKHRFDFKIEYASRHPELRGSQTDLLYVFFWGYKVPEGSGFGKNQVIKDVASWAWCHPHKNYPVSSKEDFVQNYLDDCGIVTTPTAEIYTELASEGFPIVHCPNGVEDRFYANHHYYPQGRLKIGWVGNAEDEHGVKGLKDVLLPSTVGYDFKISGGGMSRAQLKKFYANIDVLAISSSYESQPLPLLESMSAGCFPVCTNVGIVPELITSGVNGLVVERSPEAFADAFKWCANNVELLRARRAEQRKCAAAQTWDVWASRFGNLFDFALANRYGANLSLPPELVAVVNRNVIEHHSNRSIKYKKMSCGIFAGSWIEASDALRRFFWGSRFSIRCEKGLLNWYNIKFGFFSAVIRRFQELQVQGGISYALFRAVRSLKKSFLRIRL
jgi:glycosyltransferase involved in cell wall biosynthesis